MRTSWKVGLATSARDPVPCAIPRAKVAFPAPSSPISNTTSPLRRRSPRSIPARSVSAGEFVIRSAKVVVAGAREPDLGTTRVDRPHGRIRGQLADRLHPGLLEDLLGPDADQLRLLPARQRILQRRARRPRHVLAPHRAPAAAHRLTL